MVPEITVITIYFRDVLVLRSCFLIECGTFFEIYRQTKKLVHYHLKQKQFNNKTGSICIEIINYIMITNGIVSECWYYYQGYLISPRKLKQEMISSDKKTLYFFNTIYFYLDKLHPTILQLFISFERYDFSNPSK